LALHASFRKIPDLAKLVNFGNCFRYPNKNWNIACEFELKDGTKSKISLAIEVLPALAIGRVYKKDRIIRPKSEFSAIDLPSASRWSIQTMADYEKFTNKSILLKEYANQQLFRFAYKQYYVWIPCIELARVLFFKTALNTRTAFYEPNLNRLIDVEVEASHAHIRLAEAYPHNLLDIKAHQSYLAWLNLNPEVTNSYLSIFKNILKKSTDSPSAKLWLFEFEPFNMEGVFIRTYTKSHGRNLFVEEICSVASLPMTDQFHTISFHHPLDIKFEKEVKPQGDRMPVKARPREEFDPETSDSENPSNLSRAKILDVPKGSLYFNEVLNTQRVFEIQIVETKGAGESNNDKPELKHKTLSVLGGKGKGQHKSADFKSLDDASPANVGFFNYIRKALELLKDIEHLGVSEIYEKTEIIKSSHTKKFIYIKGTTKRAFLYAQLEVAGGDCIHLIEIDLTDNHSLTTLAFRLRDDSIVETTIKTILDNLVNKSGHWDREQLQSMTLMHACIRHPNKLEAGLPESVYQNWAQRIANAF
jgi:transcriptional regulator CtsR